MVDTNDSQLEQIFGTVSETLRTALEDAVKIASSLEGVFSEATTETVAEEKSTGNFLADNAPGLDEAFSGPGETPVNEEFEQQKAEQQSKEGGVGM